MTPILGLNGAGIEYDVVTVRSCARGITAANAFCFSTPAANLTMIGGIGMTTMAGNALLMHALMALRGDLAAGWVTEAEFRRRIAESDFRHIPNWNGENPFARNYAPFVDSVAEPKIIWNKMRGAMEEMKENGVVENEVTSSLSH